VAVLLTRKSRESRVGGGAAGRLWLPRSFEKVKAEAAGKAKVEADSRLRLEAEVKARGDIAWGVPLT
jgi:hypothetical protein